MGNSEQQKEGTGFTGLPLALRTSRPSVGKERALSVLSCLSFLIGFVLFSFSPTLPLTPFLKISQTMATFPVTGWVQSQAAVQKHPSGQQMAVIELKAMTHSGDSQQVSWNSLLGRECSPLQADAQPRSRAQEDSDSPYSGRGSSLPCSQFS